MRGVLLCGVVAVAGASQSQVDIKVVAMQGDPVPGTPYTVGYLPYSGKAVVTASGYVYFEAETCDDQGDCRDSNLVVDPDGELHLITRPSMTPQGIPDGLFLAASHEELIPDLHYAGTTINIGEHRLVMPYRLVHADGSWAQMCWLEWDRDTGTSVVLVDDGPLIVDGELREVSVTSTFDNYSMPVQFDSADRPVLWLGQSDPSGASESSTVIGRWMPGEGVVSIIETGDPLPAAGVGSEISSIWSFRVNPDDSLLVEAHVRYVDESSERVVLLVQPGGDISIGFRIGDPLPGVTPEATITDVGVPKFFPGSVVSRATFEDPQSGDTETALVQMRSDGTHRLVVRSGFADPRLTNGQSIVKLANSFKADGVGNVITRASLVDAAGSLWRNGFLACNADGTVHEFAFEGDVLPNGSTYTPSPSAGASLTLASSGHASISTLRSSTDSGQGNAAWAWNGTTAEAYAYRGVTYPGPNFPVGADEFFTPVYPGAGFAVEENGDIIFTPDWHHEGGLRLRSPNGLVSLLFHKEQIWTIRSPRGELVVGSPREGLLPSSTLEHHAQLEGPDAVGPESAVATWWSSSEGDVLTLVSLDPCPADVNDDGQVSPNDFNAWINAYNSNTPACDQNGDGECRQNDFNAWILNFNAGCP
ncbi:MAG: GC-type dockerin domain-anchored protein [Planctomycetota bacterium]